MPHPLVVAILLILSAALFFLYWPPPQIAVRNPPVVDERLLAQGEYLVRAGGCHACHTAEDGEFLAGGRPLESALGTFYSPNITPDPETGIGNWTDAAFVRAFQHGVNARGQHYYPAFPYLAYTGLDQQVLLAMRAYLSSLPPVHRPNRAHELAWYARFRPALRVWKLVNFTPWRFEPDPLRGQNWNRGALLARHLGYCAECHSPRDWTGGIIEEYRYAGNPEGSDGQPVPNITPHEEGIADWSAGDVARLLELGRTPGGEMVDGEMATLIKKSTSGLRPEDRRAIGEYLLSLPPRPTPR